MKKGIVGTVLFAKGVSKGSKIVAILLVTVALVFLALGIAMLFTDSANLGWLPALAFSAVFCLMSWLLARKKV